MINNRLLAHRTQRYEIVANNGQVLEHGFTSQKKTRDRIKGYKKIYPEEHFTIRGYDRGKYGNE